MAATISSDLHINPKDDGCIASFSIPPGYDLESITFLNGTVQVSAARLVAKDDWIRAAGPNIKIIYDEIKRGNSLFYCTVIEENNKKPKADNKKTADWFTRNVVPYTDSHSNTYEAGASMAERGIAQIQDGLKLMR